MDEYNSFGIYAPEDSYHLALQGSIAGEPATMIPPIVLGAPIATPVSSTNSVVVVQIQLQLVVVIVTGGLAFAAIGLAGLFLHHYLWKKRRPKVRLATTVPAPATSATPASQRLWVAPVTGGRNPTRQLNSVASLFAKTSPV